MGKKKKLRAFKRLAASMPAVNVASHEVHRYTGAEILAWDTVKEIGGKPIDPEKTYLYNEPVFMIQNNRRVMKRAFLRNGTAGIVDVFNSTAKLMADQKA